MVEELKEKQVFKVCKHCTEWMRKNSKVGQCLLTDKRMLTHWTCKNYAKKQ